MFPHSNPCNDIYKVKKQLIMLLSISVDRIQFKKGSIWNRSVPGQTWSREANDEGEENTDDDDV